MRAAVLANGGEVPGFKVPPIQSVPLFKGKDKYAEFKRQWAAFAKTFFYTHLTMKHADQYGYAFFSQSANGDVEMLRVLASCPSDDKFSFEECWKCFDKYFEGSGISECRSKLVLFDRQSNDDPHKMWIRLKALTNDARAINYPVADEWLVEKFILHLNPIEYGDLRQYWRMKHWRELHAIGDTQVRPTNDAFELNSLSKSNLGSPVRRPTSADSQRITGKRTVMSPTYDEIETWLSFFSSEAANKHFSNTMNATLLPSGSHSPSEKLRKYHALNKNEHNPNGESENPTKKKEQTSYGYIPNSKEVHMAHLAKDIRDEAVLSLSPRTSTKNASIPFRPFTPTKTVVPPRTFTVLPGGKAQPEETLFTAAALDLTIDPIDAYEKIEFVCEAAIRRVFEAQILKFLPSKHVEEGVKKIADNVEKSVFEIIRTFSSFFLAVDNRNKRLASCSTITTPLETAPGVNAKSDALPISSFSEFHPINRSSSTLSSHFSSRCKLCQGVYTKKFSRRRAEEKELQDVSETTQHNVDNDLGSVSRISHSRPTSPHNKGMSFNFDGNIDLSPFHVCGVCGSGDMSALLDDRGSQVGTEPAWKSRARGMLRSSQKGMDDARRRRQFAIVNQVNAHQDLVRKAEGLDRNIEDNETASTVTAVGGSALERTQNLVATGRLRAGESMGYDLDGHTVDGRSYTRAHTHQCACCGCLWADALDDKKNGLTVITLASVVELIGKENSDLQRRYIKSCRRMSTMRSSYEREISHLRSMLKSAIKYVPSPAMFEDRLKVHLFDPLEMESKADEEDYKRDTINTMVNGVTDTTALKDILADTVFRMRQSEDANRKLTDLNLSLSTDKNALEAKNSLLVSNCSKLEASLNEAREALEQFTKNQVNEVSCQTIKSMFREEPSTETQVEFGREVFRSVTALKERDESLIKKTSILEAKIAAFNKSFARRRKNSFNISRVFSFFIKPTTPPSSPKKVENPVRASPAISPRSPRPVKSVLRTSSANRMTESKLCQTDFTGTFAVQSRNSVSSKQQGNQLVLESSSKRSNNTIASPVISPRIAHPHVSQNVSHKSMNSNPSMSRNSPSVSNRETAKLEGSVIASPESPPKHNNKSTRLPISLKSDLHKVSQDGNGKAPLFKTTRPQSAHPAGKNAANTSTSSVLNPPPNQQHSLIIDPTTFASDRMSDRALESAEEVSISSQVAISNHGLSDEAKDITLDDIDDDDDDDIDDANNDDGCFIVHQIPQQQIPKNQPSPVKPSSSQFYTTQPQNVNPSHNINKYINQTTKRRDINPPSPSKPSLSHPPSPQSPLSQPPPSIQLPPHPHAPCQTLQGVIDALALTVQSNLGVREKASSGSDRPLRECDASDVYSPASIRAHGAGIQMVLQPSLAAIGSLPSVRHVIRAQSAKTLRGAKGSMLNDDAIMNGEDITTTPQLINSDDHDPARINIFRNNLDGKSNLYAGMMLKQQQIRGIGGRPQSALANPFIHASSSSLVTSSSLSSLNKTPSSKHLKYGGMRNLLDEGSNLIVMDALDRLKTLQKVRRTQLIAQMKLDGRKGSMSQSSYPGVATQNGVMNGLLSTHKITTNLSNNVNINNKNK